MFHCGYSRKGPAAYSEQQHLHLTDLHSANSSEIAAPTIFFNHPSGHSQDVKSSNCCSIADFLRQDMAKCLAKNDRTSVQIYELFLSDLINHKDECPTIRVMMLVKFHSKVRP